LSARAMSNPGSEQNPTQSTPAPAQGNPFVQAGTQEHNFHTQFAFDVNKQIGKLEVGLDHIEKRMEKVEGKLDQVHLDVSGAKKIAWAFGVILSIMGALGLMGLNKILDLVVAHYSK